MRYNFFMKYSMGIFLMMLLFGPFTVFSQNVGIGTTSPAPSAKLDISSTTSGLLPPRMTTGQRDAINTAVAGLIIYNTVTNSLEVFDGISWSPLIKQGSVVNAASSRKLYGGFGDDAVYAMEPAVSGGYFLLGSSYSTNTGTISNVTVNSGGFSDMWLMRIDASGSILWQQFFGGINGEFGICLSATTDGGCIIGGYSNNPSGGIFTGSGYGSTDGLVIKINATGALQWYKILGGNSNENIYSVKQTSDGGYILCGSSLSSNSGSLAGINSNGSQDGWIIKLDASGNSSWQKLLGGSLSDYFTCISQTSDLGFILSGSSSSSNTGTLAGTTGNGASDVWVVKLNSLGNLQWQKLLGGSGSDFIDSYASNGTRQTADGGYIVGAHTYSSNTGTLTGLTSNGASDCWVIKLDGFGNLEWQKLLGGLGEETSTSITNTLQGGSVVIGYSFSNNTGTFAGFNLSGSYDAFMIRLDASGNIIFKKLIGGIYADAFYSVLQTTEGFVLAGFSSSAGTGYLNGLTGNGGNDAWLLKVDANGNTY